MSLYLTILLYLIIATTVLVIKFFSCNWAFIFHSFDLFFFKVPLGFTQLWHCISQFDFIPDSWQFWLYFFEKVYFCISKFGGTEKKCYYNRSLLQQYILLWNVYIFVWMWKMCTKEYDQHWVALLVNISIGCDIVTFYKMLLSTFSYLSQLVRTQTFVILFTQVNSDLTTTGVGHLQV